jgi:alpha-L-fucosidase
MFEPTFESLRERVLPEWFDDAKFGIFVHWYPAAVPAFAPLSDDLFVQTREKGEFTAFSESPYAEWYVNSLAIPGSSVQRHHRERYGDKPYDEFVDEFFVFADSWDPHEWSDLFSASGARYSILGTRHIDGALLWPSVLTNPFKGSRYSSKRDLVGEAVDAVRGAGLRTGLYYCGGLDLTFQGLGYAGWGQMLAATPQTEEYHDYVSGHFHELIDRYAPDVLWNDVGYPGGSANAHRLLCDYYGVNPDGVVNDRFDLLGVMTGTAHCDFVTPEYSSGSIVASKKFETCRGIGNSFGYNQLDDDSTSASLTELVRLMVNIVADGGNLLLNVGPMASGRIPFVQRQRLLGIGQWLSVNGEAVYGSRPHEISRLNTTDGVAVRLVRKGGDTFAFVLGRPNSRDLIIDGLPDGEVFLLGNIGPLQRSGSMVQLPTRPDDGPGFVLRLTPNSAAH